MTASAAQPLPSLQRVAHVVALLARLDPSLLTRRGETQLPRHVI